MGKAKIIADGLERVLNCKRSQTSFKEWFLYQEIKMEVRKSVAASGRNPDDPDAQSAILLECVRKMPLSIPEGSAIAGSMDGAFSPSYALINPSFKVESFAGYCDPIAVYDDISPADGVPSDRIQKVRDYLSDTPYVKRLKAIYEDAGEPVKEVAYFIEPVTGHVIPDCRGILRDGCKGFAASKADKTPYSKTMKESLEAACLLASRYAELAGKLKAERASDKDECARLDMIAANCRKVPASPASTLHEAIQSYALLWQAMCLEQGPNPYAFSAGNLDRVFQPYLKDTPFEEAVETSRHLLAFLMVGSRCWAISQNILLGGKGNDGRDMTYVMLEAFKRSNCPQPALSVKIHSKTPERLVKALGSFFFTHGHSTPSLFNDDSMSEVLRAKGVAPCDIEDWAIAGCQEPLIMGKENANTTNSWLNLAKTLELAMNDGKSLLTGRQMGLSWEDMGFDGAADAFNNLEVAFWSVMMGCLDSGRDMRDVEVPGTKYFASGCLIHGLSVVADSLVAARRYIDSGIGSADELLSALRKNFEGHEKIHDFLCSQPKYGNNMEEPDTMAASVADIICKKVSSFKNPAGSPFLPDFSTPSTHLLYGYWVGATPDGRESRRMLGYGIDPRPGVAYNGYWVGRLPTDANPAGCSATA